VSGSIRLSGKHGVNPALLVCFLCGKETGVALLGLLKGDAEAPRRMCDPEPCNECKDLMERGVILISVDESKTTDPANPYRTGGWVVLRDTAVARMFNPPMREHILKVRAAFLADDAWDRLGLPRGEVGL
jgi:hypothetical protein